MDLPIISSRMFSGCACVLLFLLPTVKTDSSKMSYGGYSDTDIYNTYSRILSYYVIAGVIIGVFSILSLIIGCIMLTCCKKKPRQGYIVNSNTGGQTGTTIPGAPGTVQSVHQYPHPPPYVQF